MKCPSQREFAISNFSTVETQKSKAQRLTKSVATKTGHRLIKKPDRNRRTSAAPHIDCGQKNKRPVHMPRIDNASGLVVFPIASETAHLLRCRLPDHTTTDGEN
jgi:hypothetical protein